MNSDKNAFSEQQRLNEQLLLNAIADALSAAYATNNTEHSHYEHIGRNVDELSWTLPPACYRMCWWAFTKYTTPQIQVFFDEHPHARFRFQLMTALADEISYTTMLMNSIADKTRNALCTRHCPLDKYLASISFAHIKEVLDAFYMKPQDYLNREACEKYARDMFHALDHAYQKHFINGAFVQSAALPLPCGM